MNNINLNLYRIFYTVAKSNSLIEAANKLYISQPAISKDIKKLEEELNTKLLYRKNNGIILTKEGEEFVKYLNMAFGILNVGEEILKQKNDLSSGTLAIGCPSHISSLFLMEIIQEFKKVYPSIKIEIMSASTKQLLELLEEHVVDFIIDTSIPDTEYNNLETKLIKKFDSIFISNKKLKIKSLKELENKDWILPFSYSSVRKNINEIFKQHEMTINASIELDITDLIIDAVKRDLGIGYVIKDSVKEELNNKTIYEINTNINLPKTSIYLINIKGQLTKADKIIIKDFLMK